MTELMPMTNCFSPETLAAFYVGRLDPPARRGVIKHIVTCGACRDLVMSVGKLEAAESSIVTTPSAKVGRFPRRAQYPAAALLATAVLVIVFGPLLRDRRSEQSAMTRVASLVSELPYRPLDARISIGPTYRPPKLPLRSSERTDQPAMALRLQSLATSLRAEAVSAPSATNLHNAGVAQLVTGDAGGAVRSLESAVRMAARTESLPEAIEACTDVRLITDLTAAYLARQESPRDVVAAVHVAERAWDLSRNPTTAWNRSLSLQRLNLRSPAQRAWTDYLELDSRSLWADEARRRAHELNERTESERWLQDQQEFWRAVAGHDDRDIDAIVRRHPQRIRRMLEEQLLPKAVGAIGTRRFVADLKVAERVASAFAAVTGDTTPQRSLVVIADTARDTDELRIRALRAGYKSYSIGIHAYSQEQLDATRTAMESAARLLYPVDRWGSARAELFVAIYWYYKGNHQECRNAVKRMFDALGEDADTAALPGLGHWILGMNAFADGDPWASIDHYRRALRRFQEKRETENILAMHSLIAEARSYCGEDEEAWQHRLDALSLLYEIGECKRTHVVLTETADAALRDGFTRAALTLQNVLVQRAESNSPRELADAFANRIAIHLSIGNRSGAVADLDLAQRTLSRIEDRIHRETAEKDLAVIEARMNPAAFNETEYRAAVEYWQDRGNAVRVASVHAAYAQAQIDRGNLQTAEEAWDDVLNVLDSAGIGVRRDVATWSIVPERRAVARRLARAALDRDELEQAFSYVERARVANYDDLSLNERVDRIRRTAIASIADVRKRVGRDEVVIVYGLLDADLITWVISADGWRGFRTSVKVRDLQGLLSDLVRPPASTLDVARAELLFDALFQPIFHLVHQTKRLTIIPDEFIRGVPFAALRNRTTGRFLVEDYEISVTPSAGLYVRGGESLRVRRDTVLAVGIGRGTPGTDPLPRAEGEAVAVARGYRNAVVLLSDEASKDDIARTLPEADAFHYAGHGSANRVFPRFSSLTLSAASPRLYAHEVVQMDLRHLQFAFVSACDTAWTANESSFAMAEAFLLAGTREVIAAKGPVADDATHTFATSIHNSIVAGLSAVEALRRAQRTAIREGSHEHWFLFEVLGSAREE